MGGRHIPVPVVFALAVAAAAAMYAHKARADDSAAWIMENPQAPAKIRTPPDGLFVRPDFPKDEFGDKTMCSRVGALADRMK
jgi:hypothetical protein